MGNNEMGIGEYIAGWFAHNGNVTGGVWFAIFIVLLLVKPKKDVKTILLLLPKIAGTYVVFLLICFMITLSTEAASGEVAAFLQFYLTPFLACVLAGLVFRDYGLSARVVMLGLYFTTYCLTPSLDFMFGFSLPKSPDIGVFGSYILTVLSRVILLATFVVCLKRFNTDGFHSGSVWSVLIFVGVCAIVCAVQCLTFFTFEFEVMNYGCLFIWIAEMFIYAFFYMFKRQNSMKIDADIENAKLKNDMVLMRAAADNYDNMRMLRHDLKNQYAYIATLYEQGKDEEAKRFFGELSAKADAVLGNVNVSSGNRTVDIAVNMTAAKAERAGVSFEHICAVSPELRFTDSDLFSLLINLLDNAIEGSARSDAEDKRAVIMMYEQGNYLMIRVTNSVAEEDAAKRAAAGGLTSKSDKTAHGYGGRIVRRIARKYDGEVAYSAENGTFCAKAMLALTGIDDIKKEAGDEKV